MRRALISWLLLLTISLAGCQLLPGPAPDAAPTTIPATRAPVATAAPQATTAATSTPAPLQTAAPPAAEIPDELYKTALRPETRASVNLEGLTEYRMAVTVDKAMTRLDGEARIRYTNREQTALDSVYLHLFPNLWGAGMTVSGVQVAGRDAQTALQRKDSLLRVSLAAPLTPGQATDLTLRFSVPIPSGTDIGNYGEFGWDNGILALAGFYPTVVVHDEGGWRLETPPLQGDVNYHDASLYDVTFTASADLTVVATGNEIERREAGDGMAVWRLTGGPQRDFNITASAEFEQASQQVNGVTVNSYFLPRHAEGGRQALQWASTALKFFDGEFGAYPYAELDVVETPTTAGGIEYPGLVVIAASLYGNRTRWDFFESATAHEVAHQWWYSVVGNDQVNNPWLDEALAQYSTYLYFRAAHGSSGEQAFLETLEGRWQRADGAEKPIGLPVAAYEGGEYGAIVYGRGALFFIALRDRIGEEKMAAFLRAYYDKYSWGIARPLDLENTVETVSGQELTPLFEEWVYPRVVSLVR